MTEILEVGEIFHQEYTIRRLLGRGGQGCVYAADHITQGDCALKISHRLMDLDTKSFKREATLVMQCFQGTFPLEHGLVVGEHYGVCDDRLYCKMPILAGEPLSAKLSRGPFTLFEAVNIALQVAEALEFAHGRKVLHRDLKPENIFLEQSGKVYVLDWGCLQVLEAGRGHSVEAGPMCTPGYAPLEQYRATQRGPHATMDLYALGVVLYEMVSGFHPWTGWERQDARPPAAQGSAIEAPGVRSAFQTKTLEDSASNSAEAGAVTDRHFHSWQPQSAEIGPKGTLRVQIDAQKAYDALHGQQPDPNDSGLLPPTKTQDPNSRARTAPRRVRMPLNSILLLQERGALVRPSGIPDPLWALMSGLLSKNPKHRPQTAAEVISDLKKLQKKLARTPGQRARVNSAESGDFFSHSLEVYKQRKKFLGYARQGIGLVAAAGVTLGLSLNFQEHVPGQAATHAPKASTQEESAEEKKAEQVAAVTEAPNQRAAPQPITSSATPSAVPEALPKLLQAPKPQAALASSEESAQRLSRTEVSVEQRKPKTERRHKGTTAPSPTNPTAAHAAVKPSELVSVDWGKPAPPKTKPEPSAETPASTPSPPKNVLFLPPLTSDPAGGKARRKIWVTK